jgi:beta-aspartyl-peptidase (threonine type)
MRKLALCVLSTFLPLLVLAQANPAEAQKSAIRELLARQVEAWNRGNLEGFMAGYWKSPELSFYSVDKVTHGWQPTLARYRAKYQGEGKEMGKLDFFDLRVELLGPDAAFVRGHWRLQMKNGQQPGGLFTLILRRFPEGWKIIHDHTS